MADKDGTVGGGGGGSGNGDAASNGSAGGGEGARVEVEDTTLVQTRTSESGRVRLLTLNRPRVRNALTRASWRLLAEEVERAEADDAIRVVVLTGAGNAFCSGVDVRELRELDPTTAARGEFLTAWMRRLSATRKPIVAAVNGVALGAGCELALLADVAHCAQGAEFGLPEVRLGTLPGMGGTQRLVAAVGKSRAFETVLADRRIPAAEALHRGLVSQVHPDHDVVQRAMLFAEGVAAFAPDALRLAKKALAASQHAVEAGCAVEQPLYYLSFGTPAFREGVAAFLEKREPNFDDC